MKTNWYDYVPGEKIFWFLGRPYKMQLDSVRDDDCWRIKVSFVPLGETPTTNEQE